MVDLELGRMVNSEFDNPLLVGIQGTIPKRHTDKSNRPTILTFQNNLISIKTFLKYMITYVL